MMQRVEKKQESEIEVQPQPSARSPHTDNIAAKMAAAFIVLQEEPKTHSFEDRSLAPFLLKF